MGVHGVIFFLHRCASQLQVLLSADQNLIKYMHVTTSRSEHCETALVDIGKIQIKFWLYYLSA